MSLLGRFFAQPGPRTEPLDTRSAAKLAGIHATGFARPWSTLEFEGLLAERHVIADGVFVGQSGPPVGFVLSRCVLDEAEILTVAILPHRRGRGFGRPLLTAHLDGLSRLGIRQVHLEVEEGNAPALALYRRLGFHETGRRAGYYPKADNSRNAALTMKRDL
ncbi:GNAT family N-acetyltransferase [Microvirga antarctica]|uniref:GNAT family N-acetyltransferase n=1 Tax=Microvirga antarctica TaxID=2819233 RepID=UPI001B3058C2|nr:GNAT family N-acetyltransferase [Microvirga antarctica]